MKLHPITVANLQNVEFGQFIVRLLSDIESLKPDISKDPQLEKQLNVINTQSKIYDKALSQIIAREESAQLLLLDQLRDYRITAISKMISVYEFSEEEKEQHAYATAKIIMNKYDNIESENYEAESKSIQLMLDEWNKDENKGVRETLGLGKLLESLRKAATDFDNKFNTRSAAVGSKEVFNTKIIRQDMKQMYEDLAKDILAMAKRNKTDFYIKMLDMVNNGRSYYADILAKRHSKGKGGTPPTAPGELM